MKNLNPFTRNNDTNPQFEPAARGTWLLHLIAAVQVFFWWSATKSPAIMRRCSRHTQMKYTAVGIFMAIIIPILSWVAMNRLLAMMQFGLFVCFFGGLFWANAVFGLDRVVLLFTTTVKGMVAWIKASLRFAMALIVSLVITEALIVLFLNGEIESALADRVEKSVTVAAAKAGNENKVRKTELQEENKRLQTRFEVLEKTRKQREDEMLCEADGTCGSGQKGESQEYDRKKAAYERAANDYAAERDVLNAKIISNEKELAGLEDDVRNRKEIKEKAEKQANGLLARHEALMGIVFSSLSAFLLYAAMVLGLGLLETTPLLQKMLSPGDEYDRMVRNEEGHLNDESRLLEKMAKDSVTLKITLWDRVVAAIRNGNSDVPKQEEPLVGKVYSTIISDLLAHLFGGYGDSNSDLVDSNSDLVEIVFRVANHPDVELVIQRPRHLAATFTVADLTDEIEKIGSKLPLNGHGPQQFLRAESTLGKELWVHEPLLGQVESDRLVVLVFGHRLGFAAHN